MHTAKEQVRQLLDSFPDNATLNNICYQLNDSLYTLYIRQQIELGMQDSLAGHVVSHADIKIRYQNHELNASHSSNTIRIYDYIYKNAPPCVKSFPLQIMISQPS